MEVDVECVCCGCQPAFCISTRIEMDQLILDQNVLAISDGYFRDMMGRHNERMVNYNKTVRYKAYRNFTLWRHGRLGSGIRRVVPSCVTTHIRQTFPSAPKCNWTIYPF
ncbi:hypothetical protein SNE40_018441 [Patella caerulea]|uniref:P2X purinoreceptor 7 intracellular domain-containing protein n=1 Tax=Patella caerulea TaxID=87958 RepID=A0AAN8J515_PATCE